MGGRTRVGARRMLDLDDHPKGGAVAGKTTPLAVGFRAIAAANLPLKRATTGLPPAAHSKLKCKLAACIGEWERPSLGV
jgi:hypothetical protein